MMGEPMVTDPAGTDRENESVAREVTEVGSAGYGESVQFLASLEVAARGY